MTLSPPSDDDNTELAKMWMSASKLVHDEYGYELDQGMKDLTFLQKVLDDRLIDPTDLYALQCLGFVFGRVIIGNNEGWDWWIVDDEFGREAVVRYKDTNMQLAALGIIGKRVEAGEAVDVVEIHDSLMQRVAEMLTDGHQ